MDGNSPLAISPLPSRNNLRLVGSLTVGLAIVLVGVKLYLLPFPVTNAHELLRWLLRLAIVASADLAFLAGLFVACGTLAYASVRTGRMRRASRWTIIGAYQLAGLYAVASVPMFQFTMTPLTVRLLSFAGGPSLMASSLSPYVTLEIVIVIGAVIALTFRLANRPGDTRPRTLRPAIVAGGLAMVFAYTAVCQAYIRANWTDPNRWERRISYSPHAVFLGSCVESVWRADALAPAFDPADFDESDFREPQRGGPPPLDAAHLPSVRPRNLIVIVLESVGVGYLGLYGSPHPTTPRLEALAADRGVVFENVYAHAPSSPKGLVALTASVIPGVDWKLITRDAPDFDVPLLSQVLAERGYRNGYMHSGYWEWKNRDEFLRRRGVDTLHDANSLPAPQVNSWGVGDAELFRAGLRWIDEAPDRPFHLLLWTIETHHPYVSNGTPEEFGVDDPELARYLGAIQEVDALIGRLCDELDARGLAEETLIAITGDHGESFGQHAQRVHSFGIYEETVHVPLILISPAVRDQPRRIAAACQQIDIPATLLGVMGIESPNAWQGRNLVSTAPAPRAYFYSTGNEVLLGLREENWKYHFRLSSGHEELFNLADDPSERTNLAAERSEACRAYRRRVSGLVRYQRGFLADHGAE